MNVDMIYNNWIQGMYCIDVNSDIMPVCRRGKHILSLKDLLKNLKNMFYYYNTN